MEVTSSAERLVFVYQSICDICVNFGSLSYFCLLKLLVLITYLLTYLLSYLLRGAEFFLRGQSFFSKSRYSLHFMEPEGSLPHSQVPVTWPYPEPDRCSPCPHIPLLEDPSYYYIPIYAWVFQVVSFPQVSTLNPVYTPPLQYVLHVPPNSFLSIWSTEKCWLRSADGTCSYVRY